MIDIDFIEFYIKKKYSQKLEVYFDITKSVASKWRNISFPDRRLKEFLYDPSKKTQKSLASVMNLTKNKFNLV